MHDPGLAALFRALPTGQRRMFARLVAKVIELESRGEGAAAVDLVETVWNIVNEPGAAPSRGASVVRLHTRRPGR